MTQEGNNTETCNEKKDKQKNGREKDKKNSQKNGKIWINKVSVWY